jgi:hypothetical protein
MTIYQQIKQLFDLQPEWTVVDIVQQLDTSKQMAHRSLNRLMEEGFLVKYGRTPKTFYALKDVNKKPAELPVIDQHLNEWLDAEFLLITETGEMKTGLAAFQIWCQQRNLPVVKTVNEFETTLQKYAPYYNENNVIDGMEKLKSTKGFDAVFLDHLFYLDFYAIERFGKTRLGTLIHFAKQGQNKFLMKILVAEIKKKVEVLLDQFKTDAVCYVPPTIRREVQIMKYLQQHLHINLPVLQIKKMSGIIPVPQKSLHKIEERISNAQKTFSISDNRQFDTIVLIDDAVGSGATMNEIARKIKAKKTAKNVIGIAITGSFKGFDVITDV